MKVDFKVGLSCLAFGALAALYSFLKQPAIAGVMLLVTVTSTLSDAVVHGCTALDVVDRYVATASAGCIAFYSFRCEWEYGHMCEKEGGKRGERKRKR